MPTLVIVRRPRTARSVTQTVRMRFLVGTRARTASSMRKINQQLAGADASGTVAMLEKMKNKVQEEESLAEAYGQLSDVGGTIDEDIDKALALPSATAASDSLAELKKKMGIQA